MKLLTPAIYSLTIAFGQAGKESIQRIVSEVKQEASLQDGGITPRMMLLDWSNTILNGYGCWCNMDDYKKGRGQVKDNWDGHCKQLHNNYLCISEEHEDHRNTECDASKVEYNIGLLPKILESAIRQYRVFGNKKASAKKLVDAITYCKSNNHNLCEAEACVAEVQFFYDLSIEPSYVFDVNLMHASNSQFEEDLEGICGPFKHANIPDRRKAKITCCGATPYRIRYDQTRPVSCCEPANKIFNYVSECCDYTDGEVHKAGECAPNGTFP